MRTRAARTRYAIAGAALLGCVLISPHLAHGAHERDDYARVQSAYRSASPDALREAARAYLKNHPRSPHVPDVRLMAALAEAAPGVALRELRAIVDGYPGFPKRDRAQHRICEILTLSADWKRLGVEARFALKEFRDSRLREDFLFFAAQADINTERYDDAARSTGEIAKTSHHFQTLAGSLLLASYIDRSRSGYSRAYLSSLREIVVGFKDADAVPAAIYLLGRYYESKRDYDRAHSCYADVTGRWPRSPEAAYARKRITALARYKPRTVSYLPDEKTISGSDSIDIHPEMSVTDNDDEDYEAATTFAVSLGPFLNLREALKIKKLVGREFSPVRVVKLRSGFTIYVGRTKSTRTAQSDKIRLAEEYGFNGTVVRVMKNLNRQYIYGE
ncbi:MAG TPA: hypothetical protein PLG31_12610 [Spirochaetota bacterium]|nr:hypothetical protein [Spirochaetota bacterium]